MSKFIELQDAVDNQAGRALLKLFQNPVERLLSLDRLNCLYDAFQQRMEQGTQRKNVFDTILDMLDVQYRFDPSELEKIPDQGPLVVVANHPFGAVEGVIMGSILTSIRPDVRILGNFLLNRVVGIRDYIISVDPFESDGVKTINLTGLKQCLAWVRQGHALVTFPAGEVASFQLARGRIVEPKWSSHVGSLVRLTKATVLPLYFPGRNSLFFMLAGLIHPRARTALLIRELLNKSGRSLTVHMGRPVPWQYLRRFETDAEITKSLWLKTNILKIRHRKERPIANGLTFRKTKEPVLQPLIDPVAKDLLRKEIGRLPEGQQLLKRGDLRVYLAHSGQIPYLLNEIGRLREYTYRSVKEGTGRSLDLDHFDAHYLHLFLWNRVTSELIGAYRMGLVDQILKVHGPKGLYTNALFRFEPGFIDHLEGAIEFGRSFVRPEYQKKFNSLILIWKGIGEFVRRNPHYRIFFGPVSISSDYHAVSKTLLVKFLKEKKLNPGLSALVSARNPFHSPRIGFLDESSLQDSIQEVEDISFLISEIEKDGKGIPILMKHYLKLNGRFLSFSVDKAFSSVIDGLLLVDLHETDPKILNRFVGRRYLSKVREEKRSGKRRSGATHKQVESGA
jgi:putative hemolysin